VPNVKRWPSSARANSGIVSNAFIATLTLIMKILGRILNNSGFIRDFQQCIILLSLCSGFKSQLLPESKMTSLVEFHVEIFVKI
jgi:hypothetical protein